jgi:alkanesulfonate monooxygenase SsuD/methylene tetrahydromethanopterin reductase-like flavin-dependent oxidoreductase (luciferase family)
MHLSLRFDLRNPAFAGTSMADRYDAAIDMAEWADGLGIPASISMSEHHGSEDGYIPSPQVILAAMASRTKTIRFTVAALIVPFHDPLRIAEDFCVLDNISRGRVDLIVAAGYTPSEFEMFDVLLKERPKRVTEAVNTLKAAFAGKPFEYRGRMVHITPEPVRPGGPSVLLGGSSEPAARRADRRWLRAVDG